MNPYQTQARCPACGVVGSWLDLRTWPTYPGVVHGHTVVIERANPGSNEWHRVGEQKPVKGAVPLDDFTEQLFAEGWPGIVNRLGIET